MKSLSFVLVLLFLWSSRSQACLNIYYTLDHDGHLHDAGDIQRAFNTNFNLVLIEKKLKKLEKELVEKEDYKLLSNYAVLLLKAGKTKEALAILEQLYLEHPEEYQLAANLGTAYELNGEVGKALFYIKRGMELHPEAHEGSEWVHIKILETKLKIQQDPTYLSSHTVLELTHQQKNDPVVCQQIHIQVHERFPFSPPFDVIMASLLIDLGDCYANTASIEFAKALYTLAKFHHGSTNPIINNRLRKMIQLRQKYAAVQPEQEGNATHIKIGGIPYKTLLDDNNPTRHQIDWNTVSNNPEELLQAVNSTPITTPAGAVFEKCGTEALTIESEQNRLFYFSLAAVLLLIGLVLLKKLKN